ncbi:hypothetical protein AGMMS50230_19500 [Spirochaetia bacterium]|nr:hypothetical protein AGMMS50230_19500 [Spirochaetia bacterium]
MNLSKKINEVWGLLNETALLVSRTAVRKRFENQLALLRARLQSAPANPAVLAELQTALTELRRQLRLGGYDLSMGKYTLILDGFRDDDTFGSGFIRAVLFIAKDGTFYTKTGDDNHSMLASMLEQLLRKIPGLEIMDMHYLWYLRTKTTITLSGSATETAEDYEHLKAYAGADNLLFLSRLKGLF